MFSSRNQNSSSRGGIVNQPRGGIVNQPRSGIVNPQRGGIVNQPKGGIVNPPKGGIVNPPKGGIVHPPSGGIVRSGYACAGNHISKEEEIMNEFRRQVRAQELAKIAENLTKKPKSVNPYAPEDPDKPVWCTLLPRTRIDPSETIFDIERAEDFTSNQPQSSFSSSTSSSSSSALTSEDVDLISFSHTPLQQQQQSNPQTQSKAKKKQKKKKERFLVELTGISSEMTDVEIGLNFQVHKSCVKHSMDGAVQIVFPRLEDAEEAVKFDGFMWHDRPVHIRMIKNCSSYF